jgi:uncharacterized protein YndB with AHSA1/START domain
MPTNTITGARITEPGAPKPKSRKLRRVLLGMGVVVLVFLVIVALQPAEYSVARSTTVAAAPERVFPMVNDLHNWDAWSPWAKIDPEMKTTFEGAPAGTGAIYSWTGNNDVGAGKMTITDSRPNERVTLDLHFLRPFEGKSTSEFRFAPVGQGTEVTWTMTGRKNFITKGICMFVSMDKMLGGQFEQGLRQLNTAVQSPPNPPTTAPAP